LVDYESVADATSTLLDQQRDRVLVEMNAESSANGPLEAWPIFTKGDRRRVKVGDCVVWRFGFDRLTNVLLRKRPREHDDQWENEHRQEFEAHRTLTSILNATATDFRLSGPRDCSQEVLRAALRSAASILIDEDEAAATLAREWFETHFEAMPRRRPLVPLYNDRSWARVTSRSGDLRVESVDCVNSGK
jgi:hypothetical protein